MNIVQIGACIGSDDLTSLIGDSQPDLLVLVEPMVLHNQKLLECYSWVENKEIENSAITELVVTDTIPLKHESPKIKVISVADLFADVVSRVHNYESISSTFIC